ncbi:MAG: hypothetical protein HQK76_12440 [Desulfobacterales bacterium]|nr:hypothetical protein [Desulfobacterales bacterium]
MNSVILSKDGSINHNGQIVESVSLMFLPFTIELEDGYDLRSYFEMFKKYPLFADINDFFPSYLKQYDLCLGKKIYPENFDCLEFTKNVEMIGFPGEPRLEIFISFHGLIGNDSHEIKYVPLENLLNIPIKLGKLKHIIFGDKVDVFEFNTFFNLFEFIDGIAWELSFHGSPMQCQIRK